MSKENSSFLKSIKNGFERILHGPVSKGLEIPPHWPSEQRTRKLVEKLLREGLYWQEIPNIPPIPDLEYPPGTKSLAIYDESSAKSRSNSSKITSSNKLCEIMRHPDGRINITAYPQTGVNIFIRTDSDVFKHESENIDNPPSQQTEPLNFKLIGQNTAVISLKSRMNPSTMTFTTSLSLSVNKDEIKLIDRPKLRGWHEGIKHEMSIAF